MGHPVLRVLLGADACRRACRERGKADQLKVTSLTGYGYGRSLQAAGYCGAAASHCGECYVDDDDDLVAGRTPMTVLPPYCTGLDNHLKVELAAMKRVLIVHFSKINDLLNH